jgi:hypothetical protein
MKRARLISVFPHISALLHPPSRSIARQKPFGLFKSMDCRGEQDRHAEGRMSEMLFHHSTCYVYTK